MDSNFTTFYIFPTTTHCLLYYIFLWRFFAFNHLMTHLYVYSFVHLSFSPFDDDFVIMLFEKMWGDAKKFFLYEWNRQLKKLFFQFVKRCNVASFYNFFLLFVRVCFLKNLKKNPRHRNERMIGEEKWKEKDHSRLLNRFTCSNKFFSMYRSDTCT